MMSALLAGSAVRVTAGGAEAGGLLAAISLRRVWAFLGPTEISQRTGAASPPTLWRK
jgi:hypothetical protein